jgi:hypothetical protein
MAVDTLPCPSACLDELLEGLVAQAGERHRPLFKDILNCAYALGRDSLAYEAAKRVREALAHHDTPERAA